MTPAPATLPGAAPLKLLACAAFFSAAALRVCDSLLPQLAHDFGRTAGETGQVIVGFSVAYGLMQLVFGPLGDRYGRPRLVCAALWACAASAGACAFAADFPALVLGRIAWGMAGAGVIPLAMAWVGDTVPYAHRQATLARLLAGTLSGMVAGQLAGGVFADSRFGWRGAFCVLALGYLVVGWQLLAQLRRLPRQAPIPPATGRASSMAGHLGTVLGARWARVVLLFTLVEGIFLLGPMTYIPAYLHTRFGLSLSAAAALAALYAVGGLVYALTARHILPRLGEPRMVLCGGLLMGAGFLAWWQLPHWGFAGPAALLVGFGTYLYHNTLQTQATQMAPTARGTAVALFAFSLFTGQALGVQLAAMVVDSTGYAPLLAMAALALPLAGWGLATSMRRRTPAAG